MSARKHLALFLLCLASFIAVVDTTIVSIALPSMRRELSFTGADAQWILNGYALTFGGLVLVLGRAGDLYGRRHLFMAGLALFAAASLVGGFSWEPWILVCARFIQGVGAAALVPASLSLLTVIFAEGDERNRAIGIYGAMAAIGFVVAAPVAGRLATNFGLRMTAAWGLALVAVGLLLMTPMSVGGGLMFVLLGMVIGEGGFMFSNVPLTIAGSGSTGERGLAAGLLNTSVQLGNTWGLGVVATVVAAASAALGGEAGGSEALVGGLRWGLYACVGFAVLALPVVLTGLPRSVASKEGE